LHLNRAEANSNNDRPTATVFTLAYLAVQVRQARKTQNQQNLIATADLYQQRTALVVRSNDSLLNSPFAMQLMQKFDSGQSFTEAEFTYYETMLWTAFLAEVFDSLALDLVCAGAVSVG